MRIIIVMVILFLLSVSAYAEGPTPAVPEHPPIQTTRIETDQKTGAIRFIVNGQEQARIDTTGLHVRQDMEFGGILKDLGGPDEYDKQIAAESKR